MASWKFVVGDLLDVICSMIKLCMLVMWVPSVFVVPNGGRLVFEICSEEISLRHFHVAVVFIGLGEIFAVYFCRLALYNGSSL